MLVYLKTMKKVTVHTHFVQETGADLLIQTQSGEASNTDRGILGIFKIFFFEKYKGNLVDKFEGWRITHNPITFTPMFALLSNLSLHRSMFSFVVTVIEGGLFFKLFAFHTVGDSLFCVVT